MSAGPRDEDDDRAWAASEGAVYPELSEEFREPDSSDEEPDIESAEDL